MTDYAKLTWPVLKWSNFIPPFAYEHGFEELYRRQFGRGLAQLGDVHIVRNHGLEVGYWMAPWWPHRIDPMTNQRFPPTLGDIAYWTQAMAIAVRNAHGPVR